MTISQPVKWEKPWTPADQFAANVFGDTTVLTFNATTVFVDCRQSSAFSLTLTGNVTNLQFLQPWPGQMVRVYFVQDGTGSRTITNWLDNSGNNVLWAGGIGSKLVLTTGGGSPNAIDVGLFTYEATAGKFYGYTVGKAFA